LQIPAPDQVDWIEQFGLRGVRSLPAQLSPTPTRLAA
jgi:hypothetical protein